MSNNILQWNPSKNNQQDDATYITDPMRTGGAVPGIFDKELANKLFYQLSTLCSALGEMMSNKGYSVSDADIATLIVTLTNILTKADFGTAAGTVCEGNDSRFIPAGTPMWFYLNTAPTGWTIAPSTSDALLAVKGGTNAYNVSGGIQAGTWSQPDHTLTINEMPAHRHAAPTGSVVSDGSATMHTAGTQFIEEIVNNTGGSQPHNHGTTYRPLANVGIICTKN